MHRIILVILFLTTVFSAKAQNLEPRGFFLSDSVKIGEEFGYSLSIEYPANLNIVFPDSTFKYTGYDLERKESFPTKTTGDKSLDSAVYYFTTFEIDSVQYLSLPVYLLTSNDSILFDAAADSVLLAHVVTQIPDSVALIDNTIYRPVAYQFNYPYLLIGIGIIIILAIIIIVLFGKQIRRKYRSYLIKKRHRKFIEQFDHMNKDNPETALLFWKKYMEQLESLPYTKMTTREILRSTAEEELEKPLRSIDKVIYADKLDSELNPSWSELKDFSNERYTNKLNQLQNA